MKRRANALRESPLCAECFKAGRIKAATERDHIIPLHQGGQDDDRNMQSLCRDCHRRKSIAERGLTSHAEGCDANGLPRDPAHHWNRPT